MLLPTLTGHDLRALRAAFVLTQPTLAGILGVSVTTVQRAERHDTTLGDAVVRRLGPYLRNEREASLALGLVPAALHEATERGGLWLWQSPAWVALFWWPVLWRWAARTRTRPAATLADQAHDLAEALGFPPGQGVLLCDVCAQREDPAPAVAFRECHVCQRNLCGSASCGDYVLLPDHDPREPLPAVCAYCWPAVAKLGGVRLGLGGAADRAVHPLPAPREPTGQRSYDVANLAPAQVESAAAKEQVPRLSELLARMPYVRPSIGRQVLQLEKRLDRISHHAR